ncbi:MAG TPA: hypothetical protein VL403_08560, partial [Candidatus Kryptonia bacterium]|nr:hypothetical protein [Candidatus Kryptonia bacterium]
RHADLWGDKGLLHLLLGELEESRVSLAECLQQPFCPQSAERGARFNLACVYARLSQPDECRSELTIAVSKGFRTKRRDLLDDPDLASVRAQAWFQQIAETMPIE